MAFVLLFIHNVITILNLFIINEQQCVAYNLLILAITTLCLN